MMRETREMKRAQRVTASGATTAARWAASLVLAGAVAMSVAMPAFAHTGLRSSTPPLLGGTAKSTGTVKTSASTTGIHVGKQKAGSTVGVRAKVGVKGKIEAHGGGSGKSSGTGGGTGKASGTGSGASGGRGNASGTVGGSGQTSAKTQGEGKTGAETLQTAKMRAREALGWGKIIGAGDVGAKGGAITGSAAGCRVSLVVPAGALGASEKVLLVELGGGALHAHVKQGYGAKIGVGVMFLGSAPMQEASLRLQGGPVGHGAVALALRPGGLGVATSARVAGRTMIVPMARNSVALRVIVATPLSSGVGIKTHVQTKGKVTGKVTGKVNGATGVRSYTSTVGSVTVTVLVPAAQSVSVGPVPASLTAGLVPQGQSVVGAVQVKGTGTPRSITLHSAHFSPGSAVYRVIGHSLSYVPAVERNGTFQLPLSQGLRHPEYVVLAPKQHAVSGGTSPVTGVPVLPEAGAGLLAMGAGTAILMAYRRRRT